VGGARKLGVNATVGGGGGGRCDAGLQVRRAPMDLDEMEDGGVKFRSRILRKLLHLWRKEKKLFRIKDTQVLWIVSIGALGLNLAYGPFSGENIGSLTKKFFLLTKKSLGEKSTTTVPRGNRVRPGWCVIPKDNETDIWAVPKRTGGEPGCRRKVIIPAHPIRENSGPHGESVRRDWPRGRF